jgi:hypothetical protein
MFAWGVGRLSNRCVAGLAVCATVLGATAASLAAYGAYAMRPARVPESLAIAAFAAEPQMPNRAAKAARLSMLPQPAPAPEAASAAPPPQDTPAAAEPAAVSAEPAAAPHQAAETKLASVAPTMPLPRERPKRLLPPPPPAPAPPAAAAVLDDSQIAGLRGRLRLTSEQAEYWPAVEAALRDVVRTQLRGAHGKVAHAGRAGIDINSPAVQKLIWAAMPLLARLREDQKREVRKIARVMGLEQIASQI